MKKNGNRTDVDFKVFHQEKKVINEKKKCEESYHKIL